MLRQLIKSLFVIGVVLLCVNAAFAAPNLINYQGVLTDNLGAPVTNATQAITFRLYDDALDGNLLWQEVRTVDVQNGSYNLLLGSVTPLPPTLFTGGNRWIELVVSGEVLSGRQQLVSVPYALSANLAETVVDASIMTQQLQDGAISPQKLGLQCLPGETFVKLASGWGCAVRP